ncbi:FGGY family carbohydrate kinase [Sphingomonas humi]|uniref:ATP:glycerol 3-phosphotransferase n=1 Tax=Sphingomonas humi TaxID=335630 RepID=A0ABP7S3T2_9SPHN
MTDRVILAIDQGTTNTKGLLVRDDGSVLLMRSRAMRVDHPRPGWAEQSALEIWEAVAGLIGELVAAAPHAQVQALAISNQRETVVLWEKESGRPVGPAVIWQCQRSAERCASLRAGGHESAVVERSGLALDPLFPAAKIAWLLDSIPNGRERAAAGELRCGTIDSWLLWNLTGGTVHATDHGNASRTQLFNLATLEWDPELARLFDVPLSILPEIRSSDSLFGTVAAGVTALPDGTPVHAMVGDSHAALFAHDIGAPGRTKVTIGTGSSLMTATHQRVHSSHGLSSTIAWSRDGQAQHALEGNISVSGHAAAFATGLLGLRDEAELTSLAVSVTDSGGVIFVPALVGLGAPHWCGEARGSIFGMTLATKPAHIARATLEAIALQITDVVAALEADLENELPELSVDGGAAANALLMQMLADFSGRSIVRPAIQEASALGAARMALEALGVTNSTFQPAEATRFTPVMRPERRRQVVQRWRAAVSNTVAAAMSNQGLSGAADQRSCPASATA